MAEITVKQLAQIVNRSVETLLAHMKAAGLKARSADDVVSDTEKRQLVDFLKRSYSDSSEAEQITLKSKTKTIIKTPVSGGKAKAVNVEVRKSRTFVKPISYDYSQLEKLGLRKREGNPVDTHKTFKVNDLGLITEIDMSNLELTGFPDLSKINFSKLEILNISNNNISDFVFESTNVSNINVIDLSNNPLKSIRFNGVGINSLDSLIFDKNIIQYIRIEGANISAIKIFENMSNLYFFGVFNNKVSIIEADFSACFMSLREIIIENSYLRLFSISKSENFPKLEIIKLNNNYINDIHLPFEFFNQSRPYLNVELLGNPLPELLMSILDKTDIEEKRQGLRDLFFDTIQLKRVKLILIGNTGTGKTTIYKVLKKCDTDDYIERNGDSTDTINIFNYKINKEDINEDMDIEVKGYDFGGQDYYHSIHYSFFSSNALYFLLWGVGQNIYHRSYYDRKNSTGDVKKEICYPLDYWLSSISFLLKDNLYNNFNKLDRHDSSIMLNLVQNPLVSSEGVIDHNYELNVYGLKKKYPFINDVITIDPLTKDNFDKYSETSKNIIDDYIRKFARPITYPKILKKPEYGIRNEERAIEDGVKFGLSDSNDTFNPKALSWISLPNFFVLSIIFVKFLNPNGINICWNQVKNNVREKVN